MKTLMAMAVAALCCAGVAEQDRAGTVMATVETSLGTIELELDAAKAPLSVSNFVAYAESGHYDGTVFHRVIDGFMVQGGGFTSDMRQKATRAPIRNEATNGLKNLRGTIAMARTPEVDSATSQFFINLKDNAFLDFAAPNPRQFGYAVFGRVTKGMEVVDKIAKVRTGTFGFYRDVPTEPVTIRKVTTVARASGAQVPAFAGKRAEPGVFETIRSRTSIRKFDPSREVSAADEERILRAAMCAPSAMNKQPWEFVVIRDPAKLRDLGAALPYSRVGNGARMAIVVCGSLDNGLPGRGKEYWIHDCSAASMNILLAAKALGLGAVWTGVYPGEDRVAVVRKVAGIPDGYMPLNVIPIGYPAEDPQPKDKWNPDKVHHDTFGK